MLNAVFLYCIHGYITGKNIGTITRSASIFQLKNKEKKRKIVSMISLQDYLKMLTLVSTWPFHRFLSFWLLFIAWSLHCERSFSFYNVISITLALQFVPSNIW